MTADPTQAQTITLDSRQAVQLTSLLRELERFLDDCDEAAADAIAEFFDLHPAAEAFSAALCFHADRLEAALDLSKPQTETASVAASNDRGQPASRPVLIWRVRRRGGG